MSCRNDTVWRYNSYDLEPLRIDPLWKDEENSAPNKIKFAFDEVLPWEFSIFGGAFVN